MRKTMFTLASMEKIHVAIVDDNYSLIEILSQKLEFVPFVGRISKFHGADELFKYIESQPSNDYPQVVLMDIEMPDIDGIEATAILKSTLPDIKIIMLTVLDQSEKIFQSIRVGANGYFLKDERIEIVGNGIMDVYSGGGAMSAGIAAKAMMLLKSIPPTEESNTDDNCLTARELEILQKIAEGFSNKQIADSHFISPFTVKKHVENIYQKLHVSSRAEATKLAMSKKWVH